MRCSIIPPSDLYHAYQFPSPPPQTPLPPIPKPSHRRTPSVSFPNPITLSLPLRTIPENAHASTSPTTPKDTSVKLLWSHVRSLDAVTTANVATRWPRTPGSPSLSSSPGTPYTPGSAMAFAVGGPLTPGTPSSPLGIRGVQGVEVDGSYFPRQRSASIVSAVPASPRPSQERDAWWM